MADTVQFDLVSPERKLASMVATEVQIPGADGDLTAMAGHEPTILSLRPGFLTVKGAAGEEQFVVTGGFAELSADTISVLAEIALPRAEVTPEILADLVSTATQAHEAAEVDAHHETQKLLADLVHIAEHLGFDAHL
ncbi:MULTISPECIES: F0F1 ATP synthase subunit epsilon [Pacificibacter]|uniref:F0F1 ATP synthase subunit epsilon n=1 Tax=Pacificibacter TaxID=1042323 RepID=UPI001C09A11A|nr:MULTISPECIES: F0F1 ATP synthase subunit epsilon [Pacificibacter]MBU2934761.1 F0F1 ATP synthase subunit epsilon [Pacificibacter marinus]MDO6615735.1 F0F1 ATP synthase subunit epsilon [Pacificibacter sp. 1_MG-2023]